MLDHHRQGTLYRAQQTRKIWHEPPQRPASDIAVGIMGLGNLGRAAAQGAASRSASASMAGAAPSKPMHGVATFHGDKGLTPFLNATDILVVLLPLTPAHARHRQLRLLKRAQAGATGSAARC